MATIMIHHGGHETRGESPLLAAYSRTKTQTANDVFFLHYSTGHFNTQSSYNFYLRYKIHSKVTQTLLQSTHILCLVWKHLARKSNGNLKMFFRSIYYYSFISQALGQSKCLIQQIQIVISRKLCTLSSRELIL